MLAFNDTSTGTVYIRRCACSCQVANLAQTVSHRPGKTQPQQADIGTGDACLWALSVLLTINISRPSLVLLFLIFPMSS